ncbi:MAG: efflux RND transporter periplasmic adaptor subunit [Eubacteriales bacterium]|nr:efflux RND transporter periplasmic adaptor subunit [Eubacteriales bacterium]
MENEKKPKNKKIFVIAAAAVLVIAAAGLAAYKFIGGAGGAGGMGGMSGAPAGMSGAPGGGAPGGSGASGGKGGQGAGAQQQVSYTVVKTENPHYGDVYVTSSLTGTVEASDSVYLYAKASGDVTAVNVSAGDYVEAGQVIMEINTDQISSAQNQLDSASVQLNSARSTLSRMQILYAGGDITAQEYESYQNQLKSAELSYESAQINYDKQVSYSSIKAPFAGYVESLSVDVYDHVNANAELAVVSGQGEQRIVVYVTERMLQNLETGDEITVSKNGTTYSGKVTEINSIVDSSTGLFKIKAQLESTDEIATGSTVKLSLTTGKSKDVMLVPVDAIYYSGGDAYLYVVEDGIAHMRYVEVGLYDSEVAEIKSGLNEDDTVVATWSSNLYEGAHIRLYDDVVAGNADSSASAAAPADAAAKAGNGAQADAAGAPAGAPQGGRPE